MKPSNPNRAAVAYIERLDGKLLCVWNKRYGRWGWPGGKVEEGETTKRAVCRELHEETGLRAVSAKLIYEGDHGESVESTRGSRVYVFAVKPGLNLIRREGDKYHYALEPREIEPGCAVTWLTREEFLKWGLAPKFYERMFAAIAPGVALGKKWTEAPQ